MSFDYLLQLRVPCLLAVIERRVHASAERCLHMGTSIDRRQGPAPDAVVSNHMRAIARARRAATWNSATASSHRREEFVTEVPLAVVESTSRDQLWNALLVRDWTSHYGADWSLRRQYAARLVALESIAAAGCGTPVRLSAGVIAAHLELAVALLMLDANDLAREVIGSTLSAIKEASVNPGGIPIPPLMAARCHLLAGCCNCMQDAVDSRWVKRCAASARRAVDTDNCSQDSEAVQHAADLLVILADRELTSTNSPLESIVAACNASDRVVVAERELSDAPAPHLRVRVEKALRSATSARDRATLQDQLAVDAKALRARAEELVLKISQDASLIDACVTAAATALQEFPSTTLGLPCSLLAVVAGAAQWAAGRWSAAANWMTIVAAAFDAPHALHLYARWATVLLQARANITSFRVPFDAFHSDLDLKWLHEDTVHAAPPAANSSSSSDDDEHESASQNISAPEEMFKAWPLLKQGHPLLGYLQFAADAALSSPEAHGNQNLAANAVMASMRAGEQTKLNSSLSRFVASEGRVPGPRANPAWGVVPLLSTIALRCEKRDARILFSLTGFPGSDDSCPGTFEYAAPIPMLRAGRITLRMCAVANNGHRSGVVELHYFVVLPSDKF